MAAERTSSAMHAELEMHVAGDRLTRYYREHYGPEWGAEHEATADELAADVAALRAEHAIGGG